MITSLGKAYAMRSTLLEKTAVCAGRLKGPAQALKVYVRGDRDHHPQAHVHIGKSNTHILMEYNLETDQEMYCSSQLSNKQRDEAIKFCKANKVALIAAYQSQENDGGGNLNLTY